MNNIIQPSKKRLGLVLWLIGMIGVFSLLFILPSLLSKQPLPFPIWVVCLIQMVQSSIILAASVWIGVLLAHKVNLYSPGIEAFVTGKSFFEQLRPQLKPAAIAGIIIGALLIALSFITPAELSTATLDVNPLLKIFTEILYGGITEELLLRWGVMTLFLWILWRFIQRNQNAPSSLLVWISIVASALLFALGHLPAALNLVGHLTVPIFVYVVVGNTLAGIMFGFLYKKFGLEAAMMAHALAHIVANVGFLIVG